MQVVSPFRPVTVRLLLPETLLRCGRPMGAKKLREEVWTLQQTTDEMTGAAPARERLRCKPGPKARVEIEVHESDGGEDGVAEYTKGQASPTCSSGDRCRV
jgi:hypothetical protein